MGTLRNGCLLWWAASVMAAVQAAPAPVPSADDVHALAGSLEANGPRATLGVQEGEGLWRKLMNRYAPPVTYDASAWQLDDSMSGVLPLPEGPKRFPHRLDGAIKPAAWNAPAASDLPGWRQALRSRSVSWQPVNVGGWQLGAALGSVRGLTHMPDAPTYAVMPTVSYRALGYDLKAGLLPATGAVPTTLMVRLKLKAF